MVRFPLRAVAGARRVNINHEQSLADQPTPARAHIAEQQRLKPPLFPLDAHGIDRAAALVGALRPHVPDTVHKLLARQHLVVGEVGSFKPDIRTLTLTDRNFAIEMTSGLMDFYYAISRAIAGTIVVYAASEIPENEQAVEASDLPALIANAFKDWRRLCQPSLWDALWQKRRLEHASFSIAAGVREKTESLTTCAEIFMLAHEFGHVALDLGIRPRAHDNEEVSADACGLEFYLPAFTKPGLRMAHAGAAFAIRVMAGLERFGVRFSGAYPAGGERLRHLSAALAKRCPSPVYFDEAATIMVAYLDVLDEVDARLAAGAPRAPFDRWQTLVRLTAVLEEVAKDRRPKSAFVDEFARSLEHSAADDMNGVAHALARRYLVEHAAPSYLPAGLRALMGRKLAACVKSLPGDQQLWFSR